MKTLRKTLIFLAVIAAALPVIFLAGRYGWKPGGFRACQSAGLTSVKINEVILKTSVNETSVWNAETGLVFQSQ